MTRSERDILREAGIEWSAVSPYNRSYSDTHIVVRRADVERLILKAEGAASGAGPRDAEFAAALEEYASLREEHQGPRAADVVPEVGRALERVMALFRAGPRADEGVTGEGASAARNPAGNPADAEMLDTLADFCEAFPSTDAWAPRLRTLAEQLREAAKSGVLPPRATTTDHSRRAPTEGGREG